MKQYRKTFQARTDTILVERSVRWRKHKHYDRNGGNG
jgi:hypothetical protein